MTINEYQALAMTTLNPALDKKAALINGVMGLCGESERPLTLSKSIWRKVILWTVKN